MKQFNLFKGTRGFVSTWHSMLRLRSMNNLKQAPRRMQVLSFRHKGLSATIDAYKVSHVTLYVWKKILDRHLVEIDTIVYIINGLRRCIITAIDLDSRFAFAWGYKSHSSASATNFLQKLQKVAPFEITHIQTDNGSEFAKHFTDYIRKDPKMIHFHTYPRSPKMNAHVERFNKTIQIEFSDKQRHLLAYNLEEFNHETMNYILWYNTKRPHWSLEMKSPLKFMSDKFLIEGLESSFGWTGTEYYNLCEVVVQWRYCNIACFCIYGYSK